MTPPYRVRVEYFDGKWSARIEDALGVCGIGNSPAEAFGKMILDYSEYFADYFTEITTVDYEATK